jgi:hypothetical protein
VGRSLKIGEESEVVSNPTTMLRYAGMNLTALFERNKLRLVRFPSNGSLKASDDSRRSSLRPVPVAVSMTQRFVSEVLVETGGI